MCCDSAHLGGTVTVRSGCVQVCVRHDYKERRAPPSSRSPRGATAISEVTSSASSSFLWRPEQGKESVLLLWLPSRNVSALEGAEGLQKWKLHHILRDEREEAAIKECRKARIERSHVLSFPGPAKRGGDRARSIVGGAPGRATCWLGEVDVFLNTQHLEV